MGPDAVVTVVLIHFRAPDWCTAAVSSVLDSTGVDVDVVVVDNSGDLPPQPVGVRVIRPDRNVGYAQGANLGLHEWLRSEGRFCLVAAHDLTVRPDALARLVSCATDHPDIGILAPWFTPRVARVGELGTDGDLVEYTWVSGSGLLLRRQMLQEIGMFDGDFGSYTEDVEICLRARGNGWRVGALRGAAASSRGSATQDRAAVMMRGNQVLLSVKYGRWAGAARLVGSELARALTQALGAVSPRRSSRRALRQSWVHARSAGFAVMQVARWSRRGGRRGDPLEPHRRFQAVL